ncbi:MAG: hypothetical protein A3F40_01845, partial [Chlamydiae bacterium RIFCSPHIGHO2_12_FULL_27_8]
AIFGSIFVSLFGSSKHMVAGPSTGVAILLQIIIYNVLNIYFPNISSSEKVVVTLQILMQIVFLVGIFQLVFCFLNLGNLLQFVSRTVVLGYFVGVGITIIATQLFYFLGIEAKGFSDTTISKVFILYKNFLHLNLATLFIGILSLITLIYLKIKFKKIPSSFVMITLFSIIVFFLNKADYKISVIKDYLYLERLDLKMVLPFISFKYFKILFFPSLAVALLSILEVSSISKGIAARSGQKIRNNQEIFGVGIANFISSFFFSTMPISASVSRTSINYQNNAKTRFASFFSGFFVIILLLFFYPFIKLIPLACLASILIYTTFTVVEARHLKLIFRASKSDSFVFLFTMGATLFLRLDIAFFIGIVTSILFYLQKASVPHMVEYSFTEQNKIVVIPTTKDHKKIRIIGVAGDLFFASVDLVQNTIQKIMKDDALKVVILRLKNVYYLDASMCLAILKLHDLLKKTERHLLICGVTDEVNEIFERTKIIKALGKDKIFLTSEDKPFFSTKSAFTKAKELIE